MVESKRSRLSDMNTVSEEHTDSDTSTSDNLAIEQSPASALVSYISEPNSPESSYYNETPLPVCPNLDSIVPDYFPFQ